MGYIRHLTVPSEAADTFFDLFFESLIGATHCCLTVELTIILSLSLTLSFLTAQLSQMYDIEGNYIESYLIFK